MSMGIRGNVMIVVFVMVGTRGEIISKGNMRGTSFFVAKIGCSQNERIGIHDRRS